VANPRRSGYSVGVSNAVVPMKFRLIIVLVMLGLAGCVVEAPPNYTTVPVARVEPVPPPPGPQWIWQPGGWHWNNVQYVWIPGHYVERRPEYTRWEPGHWVPREGTWVWIPGRWV
jgi:hypothetical protein